MIKNKPTKKKKKKFTLNRFYCTIILYSTMFYMYSPLLYYEKILDIEFSQPYLKKRRKIMKNKIKKEIIKKYFFIY